MQSRWLKLLTPLSGACAFTLTVSVVATVVGCGGDDGLDDGGSGEGGAIEDGGGAGTDGGSVDDGGGAGADGGVDGGGAPDGGATTGSAGCVDGAGLDEGEHTFELEGRSRRFILRLPMGYTRDRAWPLVLALHGNGGSAAYWDGTSGARNIRGALENDAVLVVAEAIDGNWRDYDMPPDTWPARVDSELLYFEEVITRAKTALCIDEDEIFSMGFSGGGSFSGVLACRRTDIRAIAVGGSVIYFDEEECVGTSAAWITIGTEELTSGREAFRDWFRDRAMCDATSAPTEPSPCVAYDGCGAGTPVHYCQHPAGHVWPDFGSAAMWAFFAQFVD